jgi:phage tail-like protein
MRQDEIRHLLPRIFQRTLREGDPLTAILDVMEALHSPAEQALTTLQSNFDPRRAPERFVLFLARWLDVDRFFENPFEASRRAQSSTQMRPEDSARLRELVANAVFLSQWRGTSKGLRLLLETITGVHGFVIEEGDVEGGVNSMPFHFVLRGPPEAIPFRGLIERIVESEKPAYVTSQIELGEDETNVP